MNAAETITAAIEKLVDDKRVTRDWRCVDGGLMDGPDVLTYDLEKDATERILRWHRTIDAQLAILRAGVEAIVPGDDTTEQVTELAEDLAVAILREVP